MYSILLLDNVYLDIFTLEDLIKGDFWLGIFGGMNTFISASDGKF